MARLTLKVEVNFQLVYIHIRSSIAPRIWIRTGWKLTFTFASARLNCGNGNELFAPPFYYLEVHNFLGSHPNIWERYEQDLQHLTDNSIEIITGESSGLE